MIFMCTLIERFDFRYTDVCVQAKLISFYPSNVPLIKIYFNTNENN